MRKTILLVAGIFAMACNAIAQDITKEWKSMTASEKQEFLDNVENKNALINEINNQIGKDPTRNPREVEVTDVEMTPVEESEGTTMQSKAAVGTFGNQLTASILGAEFDYRYLTYRYRYNSVDGKNNPVRLSGLFYVYDTSTPKIDFGILDCHSTVTENQGAPTGTDPAGYQVHCITNEDCIVVRPDYCGYGSSVLRQHPYLVQDVTARNSWDGYLAAIDIVYSSSNFNFNHTDFRTYVMGFSQGGSVALACNKYYESGLLEEIDKKVINLRHTWCGDGPYSPHATLENYIELVNKGENLEYPSVLPLIVMAAKDAYDKGCMRTVNIKDYFQPKFINSGILDALKEKTMTSLQIDNRYIKTMNKADSVFSDKIIKKVKNEAGKDTTVFNTETNEYKCLMRALDKNDLTVGWTPTTKITFFHWDKDRTVPVSNFNAVEKNLKPKAPNLIDDITIEKVYEEHDLWPWNKISEWPGTQNHSEAGKMFYIWIFHNEGLAKRN